MTESHMSSLIIQLDLHYHISSKSIAEQAELIANNSVLPKRRNVKVCGIFIFYYKIAILLIYSVSISVIIKFICYNIYYMADYMIEIIHILISRYHNVQPLLTGAEVSILLMLSFY